MKKFSDSWPTVGQLELIKCFHWLKIANHSFSHVSGAGVTQTTVFVDGRNSKVCAKDTLVEMETFGK